MRRKLKLAVIGLLLSLVGTMCAAPAQAAGYGTYTVAGYCGAASADGWTWYTDRVLVTTTWEYSDANHANVHPRTTSVSFQNPVSRAGNTYQPLYNLETVYYSYNGAYWVADIHQFGTLWNGSLAYDAANTPSTSRAHWNFSRAANNPIVMIQFSYYDQVLQAYNLSICGVNDDGVVYDRTHNPG